MGFYTGIKTKLIPQEKNEVPIGNKVFWYFYLVVRGYCLPLVSNVVDVFIYHLSIVWDKITILMHLVTNDHLLNSAKPVYNF